MEKFQDGRLANDVNAALNAEGGRIDAFLG